MMGVFEYSRGAGSVVRRLSLFAVFSAVFVLFAAGVAQAHSGEESYVYVEIFDDSVEGRVEYPISDLEEVLGIEVPDDEAGAIEALNEHYQEIVDYTADHLELGSNGDAWNLEFSDELETILLGEPRAYVLIHFTVDERFDPPPRTFTVDYDGIVHQLTEKSALFHIGTDWRSGTFNNESNHLLVFTADSPPQVVDLGETSMFRAISGVIGLGIEHIQIGSDHILFIVALLLPAVLLFVPGMGWKPAQSFGSGLWRVVKIATSFTVAHTITLTLGGLGVISISPDLIEPIIAISIALAALHNLRPIFFNKEWLLAFVFGLFHGFGFAGLLADLGLDRSNRVVSLLGFNLGIEIGQVGIILLVFPALFLLRRTPSYLRMMQVGSVALIVVALGWFIDRVFALDVGVDRIVEPVLLWPRVLWLIVGLTLVSWAYYEYEKRRGRLISIDEVPSEPRAVVKTG